MDVYIVIDVIYLNCSDLVFFGFCVMGDCFCSDCDGVGLVYVYLKGVGVV